MKKRIASILLALCLIFAMMPVTAFAASSQPVYVAFTSDVHSKTTNASDSGHSPYRLNNWITKVSQSVGATFDNMVFCGDNADGTGASSGNDFWNKVQTVMDVAAANAGLKGSGLFLAGNHEWENGNLGSTSHSAAQKIQKVGTKVITDNYVLYLFGASSSSQSNNGFKDADISALDTYLSGAPTDRPIFITSHFPIHKFSSRSTKNADKMIDTLNKYGDKLDLYFIWGHNHSQGDNNYDKFFVDNDQLLNKTIKFVYCAAGSMCDSEYYDGKSGNIKGKGLVAKIVDGRVESLTYYGKEFSVVGSAYKPVYSQKPDTNNVTWSLNNGVLTISGTGAMEDYSAQGSPWYASADSITSIVVQKGITRIGAHAFYGCSKAVSASIANTVTSIGNSAFYHCQKLESITIPSSVTSIDHHAFNSCYSLAKIQIPSSVNSIGNRLFMNCVGLTEVSLTNSLNVITEGMFSNCETLPFVEIPASVTTIGISAFSGCEVMKEIVLPTSVKSIGKLAFQDCYGLETVVIPASVTSIGENIFNASPEVTDVYFGGTKTAWNALDCDVPEDCLVHYSTTSSKNHWQHKTIDATCKEQGYTADVCGCGYIRNKVSTGGSLGDHDWSTWLTTESATCSKEGTQRRDCNVCDAYETRKVGQLSHQYQTVVTAPTCTQQGYTTYTCSCGHSYVDNYVSETGHKHNAKVTAPTCTQQGYTTHTCYCGDSYVDTYVDALDHEKITDNGYAATCTKDGRTDGEHCERCGVVFTKQETISKLGHAWDSWETTQNATCSQEGVQRRDCSRCEAYETKKIEKLEHQYKSIVTAPTCTAKGYTTYTCGTCADNYTANEIAALGHSWDAGKVTTEPTEENTGIRTYTCKNCGETKTEVIPPLDHTHKYTSKVTAPNCTAKGFTTYTCSCGDAYIADEIPALGHKEVTDKGFVATCTTDGLTNGTHCDRCNTVLTAQTTIAALGHSWGAGKVTTEPTEEKTGIRTYTCEACGETKTEIIPVLEHKHAYEAKVTAPTCTEKGYTTYSCACGDNYTGDETPAAGHDYVIGKCTVCGAADPDYKPEEEQFELYGANMLLGNNLAINFYIDPDYLVADEDYYAVVTKSYADGREDLELIIEDDEWEEVYNMYRVSLDKIAAKEMADEITVVIYNDEDEQVSEIWVDSVRDYTMRMLEKEEAKDDPNEEQLALYVEMLNYGAAAQVHFNYNEDDLANNELTTAQKAYGLSNVKMEDFRVKGIGYVGTNLTLESNILMNFFFNNIPAEHDDMYAIATYTDHYGEAKQIKVEGEDFVQHNSTTWKISVAGLVIADCRKLVTLQICEADGDVITSVTDSIESYTARMDGDGPLYVAIMNFAVAAYNSFH